MEELKPFLMYVGAGLLVEIGIGILCWYVAGRKGRDTVGWFFTGVFFSLPAILVLVALPAIETHGYTKRCPGCGSVVSWKTATCTTCGAGLAVRERDRAIKVRRPLRSCFLYLFLFVLLLLIVFGFIGYYCVPNQPQVQGSLGMVIC